MSEPEIRMIEYLFGKSMGELGYKLIYAKTLANKFYGFLSCFFPWKGEILPHPDIKNKDKFKKTKLGRNRNPKWRFAKYLFFFVVNIFGFITSRILLCFFIFSGRFKNIV